MKIKWIGRYDDGMKLLRLVRIITNNPETGNGSGKAFDTQTSIGLRWNKLFGWTTGYREWFLTLFGVRIHHRQNFGGRCV